MRRGLSLPKWYMWTGAPTLVVGVSLCLRIVFVEGGSAAFLAALLTSFYSAFVVTMVPPYGRGLDA